MRQKVTICNKRDADGNPTGGTAEAVGLSVRWQDGPLGRGEDREEPNGAFVETLLDVAVARLEFFQASKFACPENQEAIEHIKAALFALDHRTKKREERGVEGTHEP